VWADVFSRRRLLMIAPALAGAGYALWTFTPSYPAFALGFVLWGAGGAMSSGALQALVYEELARAGAAGSYERLVGRSQAIGTTAAMIATGLAAPVLAMGGYEAVGVASIAATLLTVIVGRSLPESRSHGERAESYAAVLRTGLAEIRRTPSVRRALLLVTALVGLEGALDEYLPLLARSTGVAASTGPLLVLLVIAGMTVGGWLAGRGTRWVAPVLAAGAGCLAAGAAVGHPAGMVGVAVAFGIFEWAGVSADARLQERITDGARATITSISGFGVEVMAVLVYVAYALGSQHAGPGPLFALAAVPYLVVALGLWNAR
jgi:hypothetical protein